MRNAREYLTKPKMDPNYKAAVDTLNLYQIKADKEPVAKKQTKLALKVVEHFFVRMGHSVSELDQLNIIHVAGTKGKGSVCALCESILRRHGLKTGLLTSPHLLEVRERIKINGVSLSHASFAHYFNQCYAKLSSSKKDDLNMPSFYRLLILLAFHVFLEEKVDVAVVEVGKGGAYDTTNIIQHPVVCGVTLLDMDHMIELGDTLEAIAWHKAGISKPGHPLFVYPQEEAAMKVIAQQAKKKGVSSIEVVPSLADYPGEDIVVGLGGGHNQLNASLAVQLCKKWLNITGHWTTADSATPAPLREEVNGIMEAPPFMLTAEFRAGLRECSWPGRCHVEKRGGATFYLDSAHTPLSMKASVDWFQEEARKETEISKVATMRILLFNFIGHRDATALLTPLLDCKFDYALFAPSFTGADGSNTPDQLYRKASAEAQYKTSLENERIWQEMSRDLLKQTTPPSEDDDVTDQATRFFPSLDHAIQWCCSGRSVWVRSTAPHKLAEVQETPQRLVDTPHIQVLVTGSVRLVGTAMFVLNCSID